MRIDKLKQSIFGSISTSRIKNLFFLRREKFERQPDTDIFVNQFDNTSGIKSSTVLKLYSREFNPSRRVAANGARITTIIDKKTQKPVEVFVARIEEEDPLRESYYIMLKDSSGDIHIGEECYKPVGRTYFYVNKDKQMITPKIETFLKDNEMFEKVEGYMAADGNKDFGGIGIRLHQLRIERMLQERLGNVMIVADGNSFPFHYDMGFRLRPHFEPLSKDAIIKNLRLISSFNGKTPQENGKYLEVCLADGQEMIHVSHTLENFLYDHYKHGGAKLDFSPNMYLDETSAGQWIELIRRQPVLL